MAQSCTAGQRQVAPLQVTWMSPHPGQAPCPSWWPFQGSGMWLRWLAPRVCPPSPPSGPLTPRGCVHQVAACPGSDGWVAGQGSRWASGGQGFLAQRPAPCSRGPREHGARPPRAPPRAPCCDRSSGTSTSLPPFRAVLGLFFNSIPLPFIFHLFFLFWRCLSCLSVTLHLSCPLTPLPLWQHLFSVSMTLFLFCYVCSYALVFRFHM